MNKCREEFEQLFKSKFGAHNCQLDLDSDCNYTERETFCAWFIFQEQKKQIDELQARIDAALEISNELEQSLEMYKTGVELKKILKGGEK